MALIIKKPEAHPSSAVVQSFQQLTKTAVALNAETIRLAKVVDTLDEALKKLNLGVSAWVTVTSWSGENDEHDDELLGYTKLKDKWGLAIKVISGNYNYPERDSETIWMFSDAKREIRIRAVKHLAKLIEELNREALKLTSSLATETAEAEVIAAVLTSCVTGDKTGGQSV